MKILFVSDSHGNTAAIMDLVKRFPHCDLYLHAGDSEDLPYALFPYETVKGNCDHYFDDNEQRVIQTPYGKLLMKHYPGVPYGENRYAILLHGHTHRMEAKKIDNLVSICPGSVSFSRDSEGESFALLDIESDAVKVTFYSLCDKKILKEIKIR